ncbi:MAG: hypothetical protein ILO36_02215 [Abditibacteriota bacterium]|nr:hypothetical protein [Abditibacteriota bacterium]
MAKIDLNDELLELERLHNKKNAEKQTANKTPKPKKPAPDKTEAVHSELLDELEKAASQAGEKSRERKEEARQEKEKAKKVKDTTRLAALCAVVIIAVAILFFFVFDGGGKKHNTSAKALQNPATELGSINEWQHQQGNNRMSPQFAPPAQPARQPGGFQDNPM